MVTNEDGGRENSWDNTPLDSDAILNPCGILPSLMPTDNFLLSKKDPATSNLSNSTTTNNEYLQINTDDYNWSGYKGNKIKASSDSKSN